VSALLTDWNRFRAQQQQAKEMQAAIPPGILSAALLPNTAAPHAQGKPKARGIPQTARYVFFSSPFMAV